jgi:hypothetical protein
MAVQSAQAFGVFEPELGAVRLRGCAKCRSPHPLAVKTAVDKTRCSNLACDHPPAEPDEARFETARLGGISGRIAQACFALARLLDSLSRKV